MFEAKYIVIKDGNLECPIIFDSLITHKDMSGNSEVISAGFVNFYKDDHVGVVASCYGKSVSLRIESRPEVDSELIGRKILLNHL